MLYWPVFQSAHIRLCRWSTTWQHICSSINQRGSMPYFSWFHSTVFLLLPTSDSSIEVPFCNLESVNEGHKTFFHNEAPLLLCNGMNCLPSPITYLFLKHFSKPQRLSLSACALCFSLCTNVLMFIFKLGIMCCKYCWIDAFSKWIYINVKLILLDFGYDLTLTNTYYHLLTSW